MSKQVNKNSKKFNEAHNTIRTSKNDSAKKAKKVHNKHTVKKATIKIAPVPNHPENEHNDILVRNPGLSIPPAHNPLDDIPFGNNNGFGNNGFGNNLFGNNLFGNNNGFGNLGFNFNNPFRNGEKIRKLKRKLPEYLRKLNKLNDLLKEIDM